MHAFFPESGLGESPPTRLLTLIGLIESATNSKPLSTAAGTEERLIPNSSAIVGGLPALASQWMEQRFPGLPSRTFGRDISTKVSTRVERIRGRARVCVTE